LKRFYGHHNLHFITFSCYGRKPLLGTPQRRALLLQGLEQMRRRYRLVVVGYVIMPEHVHLLISEPEEGTPSTVVQALKLGFVRRVLPPGQGAITAGRPMSRALCETWEVHSKDEIAQNRIWQRRFYDFNVWTDKKRVEKLRYMHRNPVKRGLVTEPDQGAWSSFRAYMYREPGAVRVNDWEVLDKIDFSRVAG
jgi:putative transposase